jgi:2-hydroxycyclohexanecarboxyl-CoA dehydrogenase
MAREQQGNSRSLDERVAIVTGGGRGIGKAVGLRLARDGADMAILDLSADLATEAAGEIAQLGIRTAARTVDVSDRLATRAAVDAVVAELGRIDILINNAGIDRAGLFADLPPTEWDLIIDVNYRGFLNATHACLPRMIEQQSGVIVSLGSAAGRVGTVADVVYSGTKAAIMASSKALARELARYNIRVNCVAPGPVQTDFLASMNPDGNTKIMDAVAKAIPMKRLGTPEDVANVISFLCSDDSAYMTGQVVGVDGGLTMIG